MTIRQAKAEDNQAIEELIYRTFQPVVLEGRTGTREHYLAHLMRQDAAYIPELDWLILKNEEPIGHIMYSHGDIIHNDQTKTPVIVFGPLSVDPNYQKQGIGKQLIAETIFKAQTLGHKAIIITGHPEYYQALGFVPADALLAYEIVPGALDNKAGRWQYAEVFNQAEIDQTGFEKYQNNFLN
ncbi:GNAT family N-acetyltransferase [Fundicoccus sp. Sow4_H7]|uniref:GNAT family N-acetyltransferase n=1 Tax=Fundicoccus sp. Sow4_H7 TaxID=3438784 RepID=UPI003F8E5715